MVTLIVQIKKLRLWPTSCGTIPGSRTTPLRYHTLLSLGQDFPSAC